MADEKKNSERGGGGVGGAEGRVGGTRGCAIVVLVGRKSRGGDA